MLGCSDVPLETIHIIYPSRTLAKPETDCENQLLAVFVSSLLQV